MTDEQFELMMRKLVETNCLLKTMDLRLIRVEMRLQRLDELNQASFRSKGKTPEEQAYDDAVRKVQQDMDETLNELAHAHLGHDNLTVQAMMINEGY